MDQSVQTYLAPAPAQSIAQTSAVGDVFIDPAHPIYSLPVFYVAMLGDAEEAIILSRIAYWYMGRSKKDGSPLVSRRLKGDPNNFWLTKSSKELAAESGLQPKKIRERILPALVAKGYIVTSVHGAASRKTFFIRLTAAKGSNSIADWNDALQLPDSGQLKLPHPFTLNPPIAGKQVIQLPEFGQSNTGVTLAEVTDLEPVDASQATQSTVSPEPSMQSGKDGKSKSTPDAVKPRKLSKLGTLFDETLAKHYPTHLQPPKGQKDFAYANLAHLKDRMQTAGYSYEAVSRFVQYMAGDGWETVRTQWTPEFNPQIAKAEKAPARPALAWLVGSKQHGTGMHRLEIALDVWHMDGEPRPDQSAQQAATHAAWLAEQTAYKIEQQATIAKANAEIEALQAQKAVAPPPVAKPNKWQQLLADKAEATQQTAAPLADLDQGTHTPEPAQPAVAPAVECPPVVQVAKATPAPPLLLLEDYEQEQHEATPEQLRAWWAAGMAAREASAAAEARRKFTATA